MRFESLPSHVERHARERPEAIAVAASDGTLTYCELNLAANRLAAHLVARNLRPGDFAGVFLPRGSRFVTAMLAVLKAGGVYVPLDPAYPVDRVRAVLDVARPAVVITTAEFASVVQGRGRIAVIDADDPAIAACVSDDPGHAIGPDQLCYVIFTSGSTGEPKGVMVTHGNVARLFDGAPGGLTERLGCTLADTWSQLRVNARQAVAAYFFDQQKPDTIRLHLVRDEVLSAS